MNTAAAVLCLVLVVALGLALAFLAGVLWTLTRAGITKIQFLASQIPASRSNEGSASRHGNHRFTPDLDSIRGFVQVGDPADGEFGAEAGTYRGPRRA